MRIYINGRFLTQRITGVQRYALEMTRALDRFISDDKTLQKHEYIVIAPKDVLYDIKLENMSFIQRGVLKGHLWEQLELPVYSRDGFLMNFCNCAPLIKGNQTVTIHDAAVSAVPQAFSLAFRTWYKLMFMWLGRSLKHIFTVSEFSKKELNKYYGIPLNKIHVTYNGIDHIKNLEVDEDVIDREGLKNKKYILAVSSMNPSKNFPLILDVARLMPEVEFIIAGGSNAKVFKSAGLDVPQNAKFIGYVSDEELMALYHHASVFVYPSLYEGFGIPPLEAMMCGCPVVVSDIEVFHEVYDYNVTYCGCKDIHAWKCAIEKISLKKQKDKRDFNFINQYKWRNGAENMLDAMFSYTSRMKPVILVFMPDIFWGGAETQFRRFIKYETKYHVVVCSSRHYKADNWEEICKFMENHPDVTFCVSQKGLNKIQSLWFYIKKINYIKSLGYDIKGAIIYDGVGVAIIPYLKLLDIHVIYSERNSGDVITNNCSIKRCLLNKCINKADVLSANSMVAQENLKHFFLRDVILIKNSLEIDKLPEKQIGTIRKIFVPARISPLKNQKLIIDWLVEHPTYDVEIYFAGQISDKSYYELLLELVKRYRLSDKIHFLGFVTDIRSLYKNLDICILPSFSEGMANVILEAFAYGMPIFVSNIAMNMLNENAIRYSFSPTSVDELDAVFHDFCNLSNEQKYAIQVNNYEYVKREHSVEKMVKAYDDLIGSME